MILYKIKIKDHFSHDSPFYQAYLGAVSLTGCGFAQDRWGQAGSGRGFGSPR